MAKKKLVEPQRLDENNVLDVARRIGEYRSHNVAIDTQKIWVVDAGNKLGIDNSDAILNLPDGWLIDTWAYVGRMYSNGLVRREDNIKKLYKAIVDMVAKAHKLKEEQKSKPSPMKIVEDQVDQIYDSLESKFNDSDVDPIGLIQQLGVSNTHISKLVKKIENEDVRKQLEEYLENNKPKRKPRKRKVKDKSEICKDFKSLDKLGDIEGYTGEDVLGSNCAVVYHTQKKTITFYYGKKLGISRSMIVDFDEDQSGEYKLKNEEHLNIKGKVKIDGVFNTEYSKEEKSKPTGRVSNKMIIIGKY